MSDPFRSPLALRTELFESYENLIERLDECSTRVRRDIALAVWVSRTEAEIAEGLDMRLKAIQLYRALWYEDVRDGRETLTCPGIVGASDDTLAAARACNAVKDRFKAAVLALKALERLERREVMVDLHRRQDNLAVAMRRMGVARLNLKQAYRHIPLLDQRPLKIGFTWSKQGRVIQRTSLAAARRLLEQRAETPQILLELQRLAQLRDDEMLARVRGVCPHLRANLVFTADGGSGVRRRLMQAPLPILVPLQPGQPLPEFVPVAHEPPLAPRLRRADVRIEDEPLLPSVRIHRYRGAYR
ncbi:MAG: hypothetical protein IPL51_10950 [Candidatus Competibacteraceae bacterium]|nr:hypothetical protein [Candidatus Competibacteraceae bacterium]